ncbi:hypothetical protein IU450_36220 [Nocardia abscessus]|uniref:DNA-directed RNA polymerase subunit alpha C-terminal domain-containing protein n=1 Tax=Nocardia abscessus TaxID=120957 RepID=UPI001895402B|nr:DNA-directed RNA polymerase subunit alpha C-terminal domain-containing protein [Nocardia abscessus]MBF6341289.1 hypothetical protein [Nocardia abscessus]
MDTDRIADIKLSARTHKRLELWRFRTTGDLVDRTESDLPDIPNFGPEAMAEVKDSLHARGSSLKNVPAVHPMTPELQAALEEFRTVWSAHDTSGGLAHRLNCEEAEPLVRLLALLGVVDAAKIWLDYKAADACEDRQHSDVEKVDAR